jgi:hypothetical protein
MFLTAFVRFLVLLHELNQSFHQISHLTRFPTACLLPGLLCGVEGLNQPVLGAAILLEPTTLLGIMGREWSVSCLAPLAIFSSTAFLGGSSIEASSICPFPGHMELSRGCSCLGLAGLGFLVVSLDQRVSGFREARTIVRASLAKFGLPQTQILRTGKNG